MQALSAGGTREVSDDGKSVDTAARGRVSGGGAGHAVLDRQHRTRVEYPDEPPRWAGTDRSDCGDDLFRRARPADAGAGTAGPVACSGGISGPRRGRAGDRHPVAMAALAGLKMLP